MAGEVENKVRGTIRALKVLMSREDAIIKQAMADFPQVDVFVHHMMDMERPYDDRPPLLFPDQIRHAAWLNGQNPEKLVFTVAFDPFRRGRDFVDDGIGEGARGAKFYPPSGYRPDN